jgi:hypothetical protein
MNSVTEEHPSPPVESPDLTPPSPTTKPDDPNQPNEPLAPSEPEKEEKDADSPSESE